ncbi:hypothetical protein [Emticicia agri]|uniref:Uncharacterized protein n=1 Tax=Emticicia agri TaxID=2492393 RepID=A0A4V1ZCH8_9BACT|nr:hypothetical protein [Emticicia agri]RYU92710.1 hypothetical protein EWM59_25730 [Emticicia agri]RYU93756.1 hypothetical protein EWM59_20315 [Emticicia agri]
MFQQIEQPFTSVSYTEPSSLEFTTNYMEYDKKESNNLGWILALFLIICGILGFLIWKIRDEKTKQLEIEEAELIEDT